ncbi:MAG: dihydrolipoyl dehydrogenase [bacterium]
MYDLIVIGAGPGGYVAALEAGRLKLNTLLVEKENIGGVCLNWGCIPTKAILHSATIKHLAESGKRFGITCKDIEVDQGKVQNHKNQCIKRLVTGIKNLLTDRGVETVFGEAEVVKPGEVRVGEKSYQAKNILIATGSTPADIPPARIDRKYILSSTEALELDPLPENILIVGGGVIGMEMARYCATIGTGNTYLVEVLPTLLPTLEDSQVSEVVTSSLKKMKVKVYTGTALQKTEIKDDKIHCSFKDMDDIVVDKIILATGRRPHAKCVEKIQNMEYDKRGHIVIDHLGKTSVPGIWACGDVTGEPYLAHKASWEAEVVVATIAGHKVESKNPVIPSCVFFDPEVAMVGLNPRQAEKANIEYIQGEFPYSAMGKAITEGLRDGFVRILARKDDHTVIGGQIVGSGADLLLNEITLAVKAKLKIEDIAHTIHIHPTLGEVVMEAARDALGEPLHKTIN